MLGVPSLDRSRVAHCIDRIQLWVESTRDSLDPEGRRVRELIEEDRRAVEALLGFTKKEGREGKGAVG